MRIYTMESNPALRNLIENPGRTVFLDANFFIPPDRSNPDVKPFRFDDYAHIWLDPLFAEFSGLSIHESVYAELVEERVKNYADCKAQGNPSRLRIYYDSQLSEVERALMCTYMDRLAVHSQYDPDRDNAKDRGEVRSLSYMAVKGFLYFAANDALTIRLILNAHQLDTGLEDMGIIQMYELLYYLCRTDKYSVKELRKLYRYQYYLTENDKRQNSEWGAFIRSMDALYDGK